MEPGSVGPGGVGPGGAGQNGAASGSEIPEAKPPGRAKPSGGIRALPRSATPAAECREAGITLPVYAIGGIEQADIPALMKTGITGIAISGTIIRAKDPIQETRNLLETILSSL